MEPGHEDREYHGSGADRRCLAHASMEPGHEDREYEVVDHTGWSLDEPQWSPVMKTGNTLQLGLAIDSVVVPQWSPVMKTGNTVLARPPKPTGDLPQWSPVMKTGNTRSTARSACATATSLNGARS